MSTPVPTLEQSRPTGVVRALTDGWVVARRNLIKIKRVPEVLVFVLVSPIMFVLLFAFVFGGVEPPAFPPVGSWPGWGGPGGGLHQKFPYTPTV